MPASVAAMSDKLDRQDNAGSEAQGGHRREFHGMRYQLADEGAQLSFTLQKENPVFQAISDLEAGREIGAGLTPELIEQAKGTAEYELLVAAIEKLSVGFILFDPVDRLVLTNERYRQLYSHIAHLLEPGACYDDISSAVAQFVEGLDHPVRTDGWIRGGTADDDDNYQVRLHSGQWLEAQDTRTVSGARIGIRTDITARKEVEHSQAMESRRVRAMVDEVADVAREFRRVVTLIDGHAQTLVGQVGDAGGDAVPAAAGMAGCIQRLQMVSSRLTSLTGAEHTELGPISFNTIIRNVEPMLVLAIGDHINIETRADNPVWETRVDEGQAEDAILHVAARAREAMPAGGTLVIKTVNINLLQPQLSSTGTEHSGPHVVATLNFSGASGGEEDADFLLASASDLATEVGDEAMASVRQMMEDCGGFLRVTTDRQSGVAVELYLPAHFGSN